jgi:RHS repeat-associated protein
MQISERSETFATSTYRYGFQGMENDNETSGNGNAYDFGARIYDSRLGRFMTIDPAAQEYPAFSDYSFVANSPLQYIDPDGRRIRPVNKAANDALNALFSTYGTDKQLGEAFNLRYSNTSGDYYSNDVDAVNKRTFKKRLRKAGIRLDKDSRAQAYSTYLAVVSNDEIQVEVVEAADGGSVIRPGEKGTVVVGTDPKINENEGLNLFKGDIKEAGEATKAIVDEAVRPVDGAGTGDYKPDRVGHDYAGYDSAMYGLDETILIDGTKKTNIQNGKTLEAALADKTY